MKVRSHRALKCAASTRLKPPTSVGGTGRLRHGEPLDMIVMSILSEEFEAQSNLK
jgi:hypothetical protein